MAIMLDRAFACSQLRCKDSGVTNISAPNACTGVALNAAATVRRHLFCITDSLLPLPLRFSRLQLASVTRLIRGTIYSRVNVPRFRCVWSSDEKEKEVCGGEYHLQGRFGLLGAVPFLKERE